MAVNTIKATIQMRHGLEIDFDADQMAAGEWAVSTDKKYVRMCFAPGIVIRMATYEAFEQDMLEIQTILATCRDIQTAVEAFEQLAEQHENDAASSALLSESWAHGETGIREGESEDNSKYWSGQSKIEADRAKEEADRAASIAGIDIDSELSETSTNPVQNRVITKALNEVSVDVSGESVDFVQAQSRENIQSGDQVNVVFGKIQKWLTDISAGAASALLGVNLTKDRVLISNASGKVSVSSITLTILEYLSGLTSNVQTQLNGKINASKIVASTDIAESGFLMDGKTTSDAIKGLEKLQLFSTAETKIGYLQDGTPVYRKIVKTPMTSFTQQTSGYQSVTVGLGVVIKDLVSFNIFAFSGSTFYPLPYSGDGHYGTWLQSFAKTGTQTSMRLSNKVAWGASYTLVVVIEYTK